MNFHDRLIAHTEIQRHTLLGLPIIQSALSGQVSVIQYRAFLTEAYHHVKHTLPLLMACGSRLSARHEKLREAMAHYISDELGHQEWILADIGHAGGDAESVRHGTPAMETEIMVSYAYDLIHRKNPCGFLGMVFVLEGTSIQLATRAAAILQSSLQLPMEAFTYLTSHGTLDIEHTQFFATVVNQLIYPEDEAAILHEARVFYHLYSAIFRTLPRN